jgi:hypothetical protein
MGPARAWPGHQGRGQALEPARLDLYGHLYPGDMDRYADRLDSAADEARKAKTRPDDDEDEQAAK